MSPVGTNLEAAPSPTSFGLRTPSQSTDFASDSVRDSAWANGIPMTKRVLDILCILLALPVLLPLFLAIAAYVKLISPGPVFYRAKRVGFREHQFGLLKFRSMHHKADTGSHESHTTHLFKRKDVPMTKLDERDKRLIPLGWLLRASGLDELPQLINVLRGEMSIVGPRPCALYEFAVMESWHRARFEALPGLTGLWQVSGKNETTFNQMISLDISYVRNWSLWLDLSIMLRTIPVLFKQVGQMMSRKFSRKDVP